MSMTESEATYQELVHEFEYLETGIDIKYETAGFIIYFNIALAQGFETWIDNIEIVGQDTFANDLLVFTDAKAWVRDLVQSPKFPKQCKELRDFKNQVEQFKTRTDEAGIKYFNDDMWFWNRYYKD